MATRAWKVGELARRTGVTVRTLHYYDEIGLLKPSGRTASGYRVYAAEDVSRLQQIVSLRGLGMSLEEIQRVLADPNCSLLGVIHEHLAQLRSDIAAKEQLRLRLERLEKQLARKGTVRPLDLIQTIRWTMNYEKYYTREQLDHLAKRRELFSDEEMSAVQDEWRDIFSKLRAAMEAGTDPLDASVQRLIDRSDELIQMFTGDDDGIRKALTELWRNESAPRQMMGIDDRLSDYLRRANAQRNS